MIQNRLNDKEKDIQGLKKQTSSLLNCAWEKGYVAGFDDGYKTGRQAEEQPTGEWAKWIISEIRCPNCLEYFDPEWHSAEELKKCPRCGAKMKGGEGE